MAALLIAFSIRCVLTIVMMQGWEIRQMDVNNAFLHGQIMETIYMHQPPGFKDSAHPKYVCKLKKSIYGLKQSPWVAYFLVYVDDLVITYNSSEFVNDIIAQLVSKLSQFMHKPTQTHWTAVKRILQYLKNKIFHVIHLRRHASPTIHAYSDAQWAGNLDDRSSTLAYVILLGGNPITWSSKKQRAIARSSTEAEYRALSMTASETVWLQN